jgi:hypothetical protein
MKKIVFAALAAALLLAACGSPRTDLPAPPVRSHDATYRDSRYGYSLTYDNRLFAVSDKPVSPGNGHVVLAFGHPPKAGLGIWVSSNKDTPGRSSKDALIAYAAWVAQRHPRFRSGPPHATQLDGLRAFQMAVSDEAGPGVMILMHHAGLEYEVHVSALNERALRASLPAVERVLESFQIRQ